MASVPRNAPCPCGSGLKYKKCCLDRERELEAEADALEELLSLASLFPLLRPFDPRFEAWAAATSGDDLTQDLVEAGLQRVGRRERKRILRAADALLGAIGDEERQVVLIGSVVAAVREQRDLDPTALDHLESCEGCRGEPAESLAAVLEPCDLWSVVEAERAEEALDRVPQAEHDEQFFAATITLQAGAMWSEAHTRRLELLVGRVRAQLPLDGRPLASSALAEACSAVERELGARLRLAALLLADTLGPVRLLRLAA
jgi:hypothetical protein